MTEEKKGVSAWLRGIIDECGVSGTRSCIAIAEAFDIDCKHERTCRDCITKMMTAIADRIDAERALHDGVEWPRFEDGEPVRFGDEVDWDGDVMRVGAFWFHREGWSLNVYCPGIDGTFHGEYGERLKRPTPKVLDADGAPIEVGDTVYLRSNGRKGEVTGFYEEDGVTWVAVSYELGGDRMTVNTEGKALIHERPDSWEKLEKDARKTACDYAPAPRNEDGLTSCDGCPFLKSESCSNEMTIDLVERAKKLAKAGEVE